MKLFKMSFILFFLYAPLLCFSEDELDSIIVEKKSNDNSVQEDQEQSVSSVSENKAAFLVLYSKTAKGFFTVDVSSSYNIRKNAIIIKEDSPAVSAQIAFIEKAEGKDSVGIVAFFTMKLGEHRIDDFVLLSGEYIYDFGNVDIRFGGKILHVQKRLNIENASGTKLAHLYRDNLLEIEAPMPVFEIEIPGIEVPFVFAPRFGGAVGFYDTKSVRGLYQHLGVKAPEGDGADGSDVDLGYQSGTKAEAHVGAECAFFLFGEGDEAWKLGSQVELLYEAGSKKYSYSKLNYGVCVTTPDIALGKCALQFQMGWEHIEGYLKTQTKYIVGNNLGSDAKLFVFPKINLKDERLTCALILKF